MSLAATSMMPHTKTGKAFTALILEIFRFNGRLLTAGDRLTKPLHLSSTRWQVLGAVEQRPLSVAQIARNMGLARQSVQTLADRLNADRIIEYAPNPDHQRAKLVCLTEAGRHLMKDLAKRQIHWANRVAAGTNAKEIEVALDLIKKLRLRLEADRQSKDTV
jgi:DNA-binding MarR family transcriptional regulator